MFDKFRLKDVLVQYKKDFVTTQWGNEKYKWEAVQCFQENWNISAEDFAEMLTRSLAKTYNLLGKLRCFVLIDSNDSSTERALRCGNVCLLNNT